MRNTVKRFSGSEGSFLSGSDMCKVIFLITNKYLRENVAYAALILLPLHLLRVWKHTWAGVRLQSWWETTQEAWNCKWEIRMKNKTKQRTWWVVSPFSDLLGDWVSSSPFLSPVFTVLILKKGQEARRGSCLSGLSPWACVRWSACRLPIWKGGGFPPHPWPSPWLLRCRWRRCWPKEVPTETRNHSSTGREGNSKNSPAVGWGGFFTSILLPIETSLLFQWWFFRN